MDLSSPGIRPPLPADDVWVGPTELDLDEGNSSPPRKSEMKLHMLCLAHCILVFSFFRILVTLVA